MTTERPKVNAETPETKKRREEREKRWETIQLPLPNGHTRIIKRKRQPEQK